MTDVSLAKLGSIPVNLGRVPFMTQGLEAHTPGVEARVNGEGHIHHAPCQDVLTVLTYRQTMGSDQK